MAQQKQMLEAEDRTDNNLLEIADGAKESQVLEINKQMENLESSIDKLNKKLNATNRQVKSEVDRLSLSDSEITEKVSETYKQLGAMDVQFKTLTDDSNVIKVDLKNVNKAVKEFKKSS
jgi:chromosome segregation ATPase